MPSKLLQSFLLLCVVCLPGAGHAVYRCTDDLGNVTYSQMPCAPGQESGQVTLDNNNERNQTIDPAVCEEIRQLAELIFPHVREEESILTMYDNLGGRGSLSAGVTSAINYVYNFRYNPQAKAELVIRLTHEKCLEKGFGIIAKQELPDWNRFTYQLPEATAKGEANQTARQANSNCETYREKIATLAEQIKNAESKSDELRLRTDKEHMEHLLRENCGEK